MKKSLLLSLILFFMSYLNAQNATTQKIRDYHKTQHIPYLKEYIDFLSIPNTMNDTAALTQNAQFIIQMMKKRGIEGRMLYADTKGAIPSVYGEILTKGATKTLIFYAHYDGQPVNPDKWAQGLSPFTPQLVTNTIDKGGVFTDFNAFTELEKKGDPLSNNWRLYGRASADDKAGVFTILNAYDAILKSGLKPKINIKFFFEGEEEKGSTNLGEILEKHKALLNADAWIISDGPLPASGRKQVTFGVRGDINMNMTVYGAKRPLHSGNYGNWAPNPALKLVKLLASMKDDAGKILIDGFYDDVTPLSKTEREALNSIQSCKKNWHLPKRKAAESHF
jgi:acetylornithine deacetylase/succinyl-diaminopimelate desuccinylase-like protein